MNFSCILINIEIEIELVAKTSCSSVVKVGEKRNLCCHAVHILLCCRSLRSFKLTKLSDIMCEFCSTFVSTYYTCSKTTSLATNISTHRLQDSTSNIQGAAWFSSSIYFQAHKATSYRSQYQTNGYKQTSSTSNESSCIW